jgi:hypothetical protein
MFVVKSELMHCLTAERAAKRKQARAGGDDDDSIESGGDSSDFDSPASGGDWRDRVGGLPGQQDAVAEAAVDGWLEVGGAALMKDLHRAGMRGQQVPGVALPRASSHPRMPLSSFLESCVRMGMCVDVE